MKMKKGIRPIRCRAGIPDYTAAEYASKDLFREKIKRERMIELMGEGHRYYDLRRWKDAEKEESQPIYGCNTLMTEQYKDLFHIPVVYLRCLLTFHGKCISGLLVIVN